jgi:hypothetical protein
MRAQANVVGVALMMGVTVVALAGITAGIGGVVEDVTTRADTNRVAAELESSLRPVETIGSHEGTVRFASGELRTTTRELRVLDGTTVVSNVSVGGLVFSAGEKRVRYVAGAVVRGRAGNAWVVHDVPITASPGNGGVLVVGAAKLNASHQSISGHGTDTTLHTNVTHERHDLGRGNFSVAIETATPEALARRFQSEGAAVALHDFDGDGTTSVVVRYPGTRDGTLVVHDMRLEVGHG